MRYYFNVQDGQAFPDDVGDEYPNIEAAKDAAQTVAGAATHAKDKVADAVTDVKGKGTKK